LKIRSPLIVSIATIQIDGGDRPGVRFRGRYKHPKLYEAFFAERFTGALWHQTYATWVPIAADSITEQFWGRIERHWNARVLIKEGTKSR
jgi:hypothetical protein